MLYDSPEQKDFIFKILRNYQCSYAESLVISQTHAIAIQGGQVVPIKDQQKLVDEKEKNDKKQPSKEAN